MTNRRIYETIGLDTRMRPKWTKSCKMCMLCCMHEEIDQDQTLIVNFTGYGKSSLDFFVYTFTKTTNWVKFHEIKQDVGCIIRIVQEHQADFVFPTTTVDGI